MSKELEILEDISKEECLFKNRNTIYMGDEKVNSFTHKDTIGNYFKGIEDIKQALQRLESIDNANPSEALEDLDKMANQVFQVDDKFELYYNKVKQHILKAQEQEKVLSIIKEYQVDIWLLKQCDYENYIRIRKEAMVSVGKIVNEKGIILEDEITAEEFNLLKEYFIEEVGVEGEEKDD